MKYQNFHRNSVLLSTITLFTLFSFYACNKEEDLAGKEIAQREKYLTDNNITTSPIESGLYYIETLAGTGAEPVDDLMAKVEFEGKFLNNEVFGSGTFEFLLGYNEVIYGFEEGVKLMKEGGQATLIIPSNLAYGAYATNNIPAYSTLVYNVELLELYDPIARETSFRDEYLANNNITIAPTESGLYYIETLAGEGELASIGKYVEVSYEGKLLNGEVFDSGTIPFELGAGTVIPGFDEGVSYMKKGGKATLVIPSTLGYGSEGRLSIPRFATLVFDIELLDIQ